MSDKIVEFAQVYRQIPSLTLRHHLCLYTNKPRVLQGITMVVDCSFYLCLSAVLFWETVTQIMWELYEIWVKNEIDKKACVMIFAYLLINIACVKDLIVSEMAYERWTISSSLLEEVLCIWISTILYFADVIAVCGPRRWSTLCKNQWSLSGYVTIIQNLGSWNLDGVICGKSINGTSGSI